MRPEHPLQTRMRRMAALVMLEADRRGVGPWFRQRYEMDDLASEGLVAYYDTLAASRAHTNAEAQATIRARYAMRDLLRGHPSRRQALAPIRFVPLCMGSDVHRKHRHRWPLHFQRHWGFRALPRRVRRAIGRLPQGQQDVLRLLLVRADLDAAGIGAVLGISANAVNIRKHHALATLRAQLT